MTTEQAGSRDLAPHPQTRRVIQILRRENTININQVSFGFTTDKVQETKLFYEEYLGATTIFEKDGYVNLELGDISTVLEIVAPQSPEDKPSDSTGLGFNFNVDDVDLAYDESAKN